MIIEVSIVTTAFGTASIAEEIKPVSMDKLLCNAVAVDPLLSAVLKNVSVLMSLDKLVCPVFVLVDTSFAVMSDDASTD